MARVSTRTRLLTTTTALSVLLTSMAPATLPAQEATPPAQPETLPIPEAAPEVVPEETAPEAVPEVEAPATPPAEAAPQAADPAPDTPADTPANDAEAEPAPEAERAAPDAEPDAAPQTEAEEPSADPTPEGADDSEAAPTTSERPVRPDVQEQAPEAGADETDAPADNASDSDAPTAPERTPRPEQPAPAEASPEQAEQPDAAQPEAEQPAPTATEADGAAAPAAEPEAEQTLDTLLGTPPNAAPAAAAAAAAATSEEEPSADASVTEVTEEDARSSSEDFATSASGEARAQDNDDDDDDGLSNLQKVGLLALGGLAVGALMNNGDEVVSNTGDRVVLRQGDGSYQVLKDDDALLRQPGSTVRTESYADGSTRSFVDQGDGSRVVTIRDASGRVLRRSRIDADGRETLLIDDTREVAAVDTSQLPRTRDDIRVSATDRTSLRDALARIEERENARGYSLAQIRDYRQVRALAPVVDVENITFRTGSAAVEASQAEQLSDLGQLLRDLIDERPGEVFLIEGHTDATGSAASNLALSDRRAESVALALTEYFDVPPENMVVQGYGESDLRIDTEADEPRNRRVAVRIITPILQVAQAR